MAVSTAAFTSTNDSLTFAGQSPPVIHVSGTWVGTLVWEHSIANGVWATIQTYTANGGDIAKPKDGTFRARLSSYTSGTCNVAMGDSAVS